MPQPNLTPWHEVCKLRDDLRSGELSLAIFAADLHDVVMGTAKPVYQKPEEFFALTYPTFNLRELVKDVLLRLAGKNDKAIRQLELTYGGGKTHTLITLLHLVSDPKKLPDLPAVHEFLEHAKIKTPPQARIAVLPFDKLDVEVGMNVRSPDGKTRKLKHPWSVLAYEIAGDDGLKLLTDGKAEERESPPAEPLLRELLSLPANQKMATLVLIDEVLMFARQKVNLDGSWREKLLDFFQCLTQAVSKTDRAALVASLLASELKYSDALGKSLTQELYDIFRREREEGVEPVVKEDVAEVLRRRFFKSDSIQGHDFRPHVIAALQGIKDLDEATARDAKSAEDRFLRSFPFHPDLTDVFYSKWTNLEGFQRTRGVLRTFALALRDAEKWDTSPLVGPNVFLMAPGKDGTAEAARELTQIASHEDTGGKRQDWNGILTGELAKARDLQIEQPGLKNREIEQAVYATFLHSQPIGQRAQTRELMTLIGAGRPDKIELEKGLRQWAEVSWFLDEADTNVEPGEIPKAWRLGSRPNLKQMHNEACTRVGAMIESVLVDEITKTSRLTQGASGSGARVHNLPDKPGDVDDDGDFRYLVLGPKCASESGHPRAEAVRFIREKTGGSPRVYQNAVVLAVPSHDGLDLARQAVRDYLGWMEVQQMKEIKESNDDFRKARVAAEIQSAKKRIANVVVQAYCIVITLNATGEPQAFKVTIGNDPLFVTIQSDAPRSRIQDSPANPEALMPDGPYSLWKEGETSRRLKDLVGAFAQFPHLPKMLRRKEILQTFAQGCKQGLFVLQLTRPDKTKRTFWREFPSEADLDDASMEVVLPEAAMLTGIQSHLMAPGSLDGLWSQPPTAIAVKDVLTYFDGTRAITDEYNESHPIPAAPPDVVKAAIASAITEGKLWLSDGTASIWKDTCPEGIVTDEAKLNPPPDSLSLYDLLPDNLPAAWSGKSTTASEIAHAIYQAKGIQLPWTVVREALTGALNSQLLERTAESGQWPCDWAGAGSVTLTIPQAIPPKPIPPIIIKPAGLLVASAELTAGEIQNLADEVGEFVKAAAGSEVRFRVGVEVLADPPPDSEAVEKLNEVLKRVSEKLKLE